MFTVVLDTSALYGDFRLQERQALNLIDNLRELGGELIIPEVVVDEAERKFNQLLRDSTRELKKSAKLYRQLTGLDIDIPDISEISKENNLRQRLQKVADRVAPYPQLSHQQVVKRLLAGHRPFCVSGDKGYRDFLIWLSVMQIAVDSNNTVIFVTSNSSDFCTSKNNQLHEDLIMDLHERNIQSERVVITQSLSSANREYLEKKLNIFIVSLNDTEKKFFLNHIQLLLAGNLLNEVTEIIPSGRWTRFIITEFNGIPEISIERVTAIGSDAKQVTANFKGVALVDIIVPDKEIDPVLECIKLTDLQVVEPDEDEDEDQLALIYGHTQVSGTLIGRLHQGKSIEGVTVESIKIDGIEVN